MTQALYTFGYEGLTIEAFIDRLATSRIQQVVDVRAFPGSRTRGFSKNGLADALAGSGIGYDHVGLLGCPKPIRDRYRADGDWTAYSSAFLAYLQTQTESTRAIARSAHAIKLCLVCFEADFNRCHRTYVGRAVAKAAGLQLVHITDRRVIADPASLAAA